MSDNVVRLMKRCQIGVGGRNALDDAHDIMAECYGTLGRQQIEIERLRAAILDWWASRRPVGWDAKQHVAHPLVNLGPSDEQLALIAAEIEMGVMR